MGAEIRKERFTDAEHALFRQRLKQGLSALRSVLERPTFGRGERTIGVELEMFLIDSHARALPVAQEVVRAAQSPSITPEIGRFDIELSTPPVLMRGRPFSAQREHMLGAMAEIARHAKSLGARTVPVSILPTLQRGDFGPETITDLPRYRALAEGMRKSRQAPFRICISGRDPLRLTTDDVAMESANTAFQIHLHASPEEFARLFNAAMMVTAPVLAASGNSPTFLGHRLWEETRIALFKQAGDDRSPEESASFRLPPRINFGCGWVREGAAELFAESVALHEPLFAECSEEDPLAMVAAGKTPSLSELRLHHGTVWRWNRPVYDPAGLGHLRIELRALPAGPTVDDMLANAAFFLGAILALAPKVPELLPSFPFSLAENNFYRAAQFGLDAEFAWPSQHGAAPESVSARDVVRRLLPLAMEGLLSAGVERDDADRFLHIFEHRVNKGITGAVWQRKTFEVLVGRGSRREWALSEMLERYVRNVESGLPVASWDLEA